MKRLLLLLCLAAMPVAAAAGPVRYDGQQWNRDPIHLTLAAPCAPQQECQLGAIDYPIGMWFGNTNISCFGSQNPGATIPAVFEFYPQSVSVIAVQFYNFTTSSIPSGTTFNIAVTCYGLAGSPARRKP